MSDFTENEKIFGFISNNCIRINLLDENRASGVQYGLNWAFDPETCELRIEKGKTESSRSGNEAYFQLPKEVYNSDFFPENGEFHIVDDLGNDFIFSRSQPKVKDGKPQALSTPESNKILGLYIRHRLGLKSGSLIRKEHLLKYGRTDILFSKIENSFLMDFSKKDNSFSVKEFSENASYTPNHSQIIYYGVPGSGKSHKIDEDTKELPDEQKIRVVFHPEYTNADFVGQILPSQTADGIEYSFKVGPFARIIKRALKNPEKKYFLIIEEINRGNASAIFGDLFQLLDRNSDGWSSYCVENLDINAFIRSSNEKTISRELEPNIKIGSLDFSENTGIRLPPNLSLLATMNTSDQNVFTLDNAFQRRWDMKLVENKFEGKDSDNQRNAKIGGSEVTWEQFQSHINTKIGEISSSMGMSSMEDKRLGCWFVRADNGGISKDTFSEKVLKYLWDDAFKFNREEVFDIRDKSASLESIVEIFKGKDSACNWNIFKDTSFISAKTAESANSSMSE